MPEHLKKVRLPRPDGSIAEIDLDAPRRELQEKIDTTNERIDTTNERIDTTNQRIDKAESMMTPNILPDIEDLGYELGTDDKGHKYYHPSVGYQGYTKQLVELGPLKGNYTLSIDWGTESHTSRMSIRSKSSGETFMTVDFGTPQVTAYIDADDAVLSFYVGMYSSVRVYNMSLYGSDGHMGALDRRIANLKHRVDGVDELWANLPWAGPLYQFERLQQLSDKRMYLITDNECIKALYFGKKRLFPYPDAKFSIKGRFAAETSIYNCSYGYSPEIARIPVDDDRSFDYTPVDKDKCPDTGDYPRLFYRKSLVNIAITADLFFFSDATEMFAECQQLETVDLSKLDTSHVTSLKKMFYNCKALQSIDLSKLDTSQVRDIYFMFYGCSSLTEIDLSALDLSNVRNDATIFRECSKLERVNLSGLNLSKVSEFLFYGCSALTDINFDGTDLSGLKRVADMFSGCSSLRTVDFRTGHASPKPNYAPQMFYKCTSLERVVLTGLDFKDANRYVYSMFYGCTSLTDIVGPIYNIPGDLSVSGSPLTNDSAMVLINGLIETSEAKSFTFSAATYDTLTDEQIAVATAKGWTLIRR